MDIIIVQKRVRQSFFSPAWGGYWSLGIFEFFCQKYCSKDTMSFFKAQNCCWITLRLSFLLSSKQSCYCCCCLLFFSLWSFTSLLQITFLLSFCLFVYCLQNWDDFPEKAVAKRAELRSYKRWKKMRSNFFLLLTVKKGIERSVQKYLSQIKPVCLEFPFFIENPCPFKSNVKRSMFWKP